VRSGWTRAPQRPPTRIVGRRDDLEQLDNIWDAVRSGRPQRLALIGEAGIGKSTILQSPRTKVVAEGGMWIEAQCAPERKRVPLAALREPLRDPLLDRPHQTGPLAALNILERDLIQSFFTHGDAPVQESGRAPSQNQLIRVVTKLLSSLARRERLNLALEDLHRADATTLELIDVFGKELDSSQIVVTWRSSEHLDPPFGR
jgi:predicted ATPase